jgi:hypothetical protein
MSPRTASISAATSTPPASTAATPWTSCTTSCSASPGDLRSRHSPRNPNQIPRYLSPCVNGLNAYVLPVPGAGLQEQGVMRGRGQQRPRATQGEGEDVRFPHGSRRFLAHSLPYGPIAQLLILNRQARPEWPNLVSWPWLTLTTARLGRLAAPGTVRWPTSRSNRASCNSFTEKGCPGRGT